ncbi:hypothetical protein DCS_03628 [Drechmeria coniospora]|uniref:C2H2-type domain-containing protein n=1 Tax=Drechmeria coniospora TaxID=98403 RepID=A0A151GHR3_DRECN|nr:hypothetical protein DCS_03628 [Drechmeria coniospora]KYK56626.1 hypothetical protein DCS_03628 [Drechmeria coniospora]
MSNPAPVSPTAGANVVGPEEPASTITVNTKVPAQFPPPKTDKPRPHVCGTCQRSFARLEHLKRHERSHTKEKPFDCPECGRCFARRDLLLRHQQKLHQTSTPSSRPRNRRESASGATPGQSRARKNSVAGTTAPGANAAASMRPRANTISHVDGAAMQMMASANASVARGMASHGRHPSLAGLPVHNLDHVFGGMSAALSQRGMQHGLPKLETAQMAADDFDGGLRTAPNMAVFVPDLDFEGLLFGGSTINPNALHYSDSPQSMALDQTSPFGQGMSDVAAGHPFDDGLDWLTGFEHQMSFHASNENVVDGSSPSAISTTSQSGISDVMLDGSNQPAPAGTGTMWQSSAMGPPQMPNPFAMDLNGSVFPDLLNGAPLSPQPASQKTNDPYFSTPPPSLSSLSPLVVSRLNTQNPKQTLGPNAGPETPSSLSGGTHGASPVTTISDATRTSIVNALSRCLPPAGRRKSSLGSPTSSMASRSPSDAKADADVPSAQDLQRHVGAYLTYFHPHLPFLHLPTLSFHAASGPADAAAADAVDGSECLVLSMAAIGALYEREHARSRELFDMARSVIHLHLDARPSSAESSAGAPLRLVQAMLLNVVYGHNCADRAAGDAASTHCAALVGLAGAAGLLRPAAVDASAKQDVPMTDDAAWAAEADQEDRHREWLRWKEAEERKRTLFAVFVLSSLLVAAYNHAPALTNSEIFLHLPCDEEFFAAESSVAFFAGGGPQAAAHNQMTFYDALGELLRTNERQQKRLAQKHNRPAVVGSAGGGGDADPAPLTDLKPSTLGCLILIYALHNYIWETRQRHHDKIWTDDETEKMQRHIEPALKAWQVAWASDARHSVERPNPYGLGPISADAVPLLDLAYVRLFVNLSRSKERFWQQDWDGVVEELSRGGELVRQASPEMSGLDFSDMSAEDFVFIDAPEMQSSASLDGSSGGPSDKAPSRREQHLRKAAFYAADSLAMSDKLGVTFADFTSRELPLQSALCAFDCAQVLAEWMATLQDRLGRQLGILGQDTTDLAQVPGATPLEDEDVKLLDKIGEIVASAEMKLRMDTASDGTRQGDPMRSADDHGGYATQILSITASMMDRAAVWPVTHIMARCLEAHAGHARARAEKSLVPSK